MREKWTGPWKVVVVRCPVNYRIQFGKKRLLVHHNRLKPYHQRPKDLQVVPPVEEAEVVAAPLVDAEVSLDEPVWLETDDDDLIPGAGDEAPPQALVPPGPINPVPPDPPHPLMGPGGRHWCNVDPANVVPGRRR